MYCTKHLIIQDKSSNAMTICSYYKSNL